MRILVIDNYDSFAYNLVQYLGELGAEVEVVRNDAATVSDLLAANYDRAVISPGPRTPDDAGISLELIPAFATAGVPILGVCLGHQALIQAFGGTVVRAEPVHGKKAGIEHDGRSIFRGLESPMTVGRYHSLVAGEVPPVLEVTSTFEGEVMGVRHRELPAEGVQFHPESVLTPLGKHLIANFIDVELPPGIEVFNLPDEPGNMEQSGSVTDAE